MPIHEYACHGCGQEFEKLVRASDVPACPQYGGTDLHRKLSVFATNTSTDQPPPMAAAPCGSCGHPGGPGACQFAGLPN
jgi:putative FmdB family regulatory protein